MADSAQPGPYPPYSFDIDMMKRSMDASGGPDNKKARWSPTNASAGGAGAAGGNAVTAGPRDPYANYGYGPGAALNQPSAQQQAQAQAQQQAQQLYATPQLSINTGAVGGQQQQQLGLGQGGQLSPGTLAGFQVGFCQQQAQSPVTGPGSPYSQFSPYNMLAFGYPQGGSRWAGQFTPQRLPSLNLNIPAAQAVYGQQVRNGGIAAGRTVYIGNLPPSASVDELLNLVHFGPLESIRVLPEKSCVFLSFLDAGTAGAFYADAAVRKLTLHAQELKVGWGKPSPVPAQVLQAIAQSGASRNVYLGGLEEGMTEEALRDELGRFGLIDQVKIVRDKNIGFVHFLSISVATKVVNTLPTDPAWAGKRVNYGKDRCAYVPKSQQAAAHQAQAAAAQSLLQSAGAFASPLAAHGPSFAAYNSPASAHPSGGLQGLGMAGGNRTVYLGNIHPETTTEDLCNAIRGGVLQSVRYMADKHIAFITFIDPAAAFTFFQVSSYQGLTLNNRRLKVGWGKNSGPLAPTLALAVHAGATRNVYIGNVEDFEVFSEERLKADFGEFGDIELVNFLKEKNCAFVNFTNISNAIKAIDSIKNRPEYANLRIAHGKDRCANPPRSGPQGGASGARRSASGNGPNSAEPVSAVEHEGEMDFDVEAAQAEAEGADAVDVKTEEGMAVEGGAAASS
ncbi:hypothetical protein C8R43DRAFT_878284 [Mycena crocata]|nr:hypothetical protein C8R43DRAFT_878284 [Mycena crocata]